MFSYIQLHPFSKNEHVFQVNASRAIVNQPYFQGLYPPKMASHWGMRHTLRRSRKAPACHLNRRADPLIHGGHDTSGPCATRQARQMDVLTTGNQLALQKNRSHSGSQPTKGYGNMGIGILDLGYVGYVNGFVTIYIYICIYWLVVSTP